MMKLSNKAQISIEMLLLVGFAIVIATVVGLTLKNIFSATQQEATPAIENTAEEVGQ